MIQIIRDRATPEQMQQMLMSLGIYIKLAVDLERKLLAVGGELVGCGWPCWCCGMAQTFSG